MVLLFATIKKYDKVLYTPHNRLSPSLNNCHLHEISLFFVLPTYVEIILMRWLHDPIVTNSAKTHGTDYSFHFNNNRKRKPLLLIVSCSTTQRTYDPSAHSCLWLVSFYLMRRRPRQVIKNEACTGLFQQICMSLRPQTSNLLYQNNSTLNKGSSGCFPGCLFRKTFIM